MTYVLEKNDFGERNEWRKVKNKVKDGVCYGGNVEVPSYEVRFLA